MDNYKEVLDRILQANKGKYRSKLKRAFPKKLRSIYMTD